MKFALINGQRREAQPNLVGKCLSCGQEMLAKCGDIKVWHWAHKGRRTCDSWWENETEWHRAWKGKFPESWQEIVHISESGERHVADIKTEEGWVIEFQHSYIQPMERSSRDRFYKKIIWVVDGSRRKTDASQFINVLNGGFSIGVNSQIRKIRTEECALLREWSVSTMPIFFDFGGGQILWWLFSSSANGWSYIAPFSCADFIDIHCGNSKRIARDFEAFVNDSRMLVSNYESNVQAQALNRASNQIFWNAQHKLARQRRGKGRL